MNGVSGEVSNQSLGSFDKTILTGNLGYNNMIFHSPVASLIPWAHFALAAALGL